MATAEAGLSYQSIRNANQAREADEVRTDTRKKNVLLLVLHYLTEEGYLESANSLSKETNLDLSRFEVCDNIDLETVLMEYESYYYVKFNRYPKITKRLVTQSGVHGSTFAGERKAPPSRLTRNNSLNKAAAASTALLPRIPQTTRPSTPPPGGRPRSGNSRTRPSTNQIALKKDNQNTSNSKPGIQQNGSIVNGHCSDMTLHGLVIHGSSSNSLADTPSSDPLSPPIKQNATPKFGQIIDIRSMINDATRLNVEEGPDQADRLLKPLGGYVGYNNEWRELAQVISRDIYSEDPNVRWDDIIGLDEAKRLVKEAVVYPIKYPQLFTGILSPWKGLLLYGPPGTGKTLLAKAVATECNTTFFNISASSIVSKWRGDSEKLVRVLFELARFHAPSTIFLDELESVMSQRGSGGGGEHEGSRRMKTELLVQMDGLAKTDDLVFLLAASNLPWELDHAMLRRLEKRILVDLPTHEARRAMIRHHLPALVCGQGSVLELRTDLDYDNLAKKTEGYSGSDIRLVCKEAAMKPVRKIFDILENHSDGHHGEIPTHFKLDTLHNDDVVQAIDRTKPSARMLKDKYIAWQREYESV